ncbi:MAG: ATP synthase F1 subunit gamma [Candidatus Levybacteria bacterium RIFCSPHIGHO2_01_FULL_40_10]|nr:MAG: ATP synthase F1 subunit gamma [Candidatus Levybacteria bacterium RIFCSPHIGHO2_01_FULL_40_10]
MAQSLQSLKRRIKTAQNIAQIAKAMEMISASKIKRAQKEVENNKPYAERVKELTSTILTHIDLQKFDHPYVLGNESEKTLLIVISPDKGLCGSLNTNLFKKLLEVENKNYKVVALGKKVHQFAARLESELVAGFNLGTTIPPYSLVFSLIEIINKEYKEGKVGKVEILFSRFNSIFSQEPVLQEILPIKPKHEEGQLPYLFEPTSEKIIIDLLPYFLEAVLYNSMLEAFTSEQAARMVAMQNAKNNAFDIADYLTLSYNKSRQERITNELLSLSNNN